MSKEHAWPKWLGKDEQVEPTQTTRTLGFHRTGEDEMTEAPTTVVVKPGSALTAQVREVCRSCNNGWMSRLEESVKPLLRRLWLPGYPLGMTTFNPDESAVLATWATKTAWIRDRWSGPDVTATPEMWSYLMRHQIPPEFTRVWVSRYEGENNFSVSVGHLTVTSQDEPWNTELTRRILMCLMTFKGLSVMVRTDDGWGAPPLVLPGNKWAALWPNAETVEWPRPDYVSDLDVRDVSMLYSNWLKFPNTSQFIRDPRGVQHIKKN